MANFSRRKFLTLAPALTVPLLSIGTAVAADKPISDDLLVDRINQRIIADRELGIRPLTIEVENGKVTVTGFVETEKLRLRVVKVVKKVKGVREIDNRVEIKQ